MKTGNKLKIFDALAYGIIILLLISILLIAAGLDVFGGVVLSVVGFLLIIFWISMVVVSIKNHKWGYLLLLILLMGAVIAHLFYFKVYRKTLK